MENDSIYCEYIFTLRSLTGILTFSIPNAFNIAYIISYYVRSHLAVIFIMEIVCKSIITFCLLSGVYVSLVDAQSYEDVRCKCLCPHPSVVNISQSTRQLYIGNVTPNKCNCDNVVLPHIGDEIKGKGQEFCPRCECKYESRNTSIIKYVVIMVIWIISLLVIYMLFLICLDPLLNKRVKGSYQEHANEEDEPGSTIDGSTSHAMGMRGNVLNRVGHQQDKWKKQVREQRRNIYDRHTMLN